MRRNKVVALLEEYKVPATAWAYNDIIEAHDHWLTQFENDSTIDEQVEYDRLAEWEYQNG
jgi:hypothetical protein